MWAIFDRVRTCHKSDIKSRKPDSKIAWSFDPYGFPYPVPLLLLQIFTLFNSSHLLTHSLSLSISIGVRKRGGI
jgi:hypothetical protein